MENSVTPKPLDGSDAIPIFDVRHVPLTQLQDDAEVRDSAKRLVSEKPHPLRVRMFSSGF